MNVSTSAKIHADYARRNYPSWRPSLTGVLGWTAALLTDPFCRQLLGSCIRAATGAAPVQGEYSHDIDPLL